MASPESTHYLIAAKETVRNTANDFFAVGLAATTPARVRRFTADRVEIFDVGSGRVVPGGFLLRKAIARKWEKCAPTADS